MAASAAGVVVAAITATPRCTRPAASSGKRSYRAAMGGLVAAARELKDKGTFGYVDTAALPSAELTGFMRE